MNIMMNPYEDHQERNNILMYSQEHQHFEVQNVYLEFQVKVSGAHDTWHKTIDHPSTAKRAQELYKYKRKVQHYLHHCKAYMKTSEKCLKL
jgi:hypothetical protein